MIKSALLNRKSRNLSKSQSSSHSTYREAVNIGILYNSQEFNAAMIDELADNLSADRKEVARLAFVEKESEDRFSFCKKDVSISGNLNKESIGFFTKQAFDFLISLDTSGDPNFKYVLALSKAACKIGIDTEDYNDLLLMTIRASGDHSQDIKELVKYLKMI